MKVMAIGSIRKNPNKIEVIRVEFGSFNRKQGWVGGADFEDLYRVRLGQHSQLSVDLKKHKKTQICT
jgi:hypothetical protein